MINTAAFSYFCPLLGKKYFRFAGGKAELAQTATGWI
jgi:hypothetical protein